MGEHDAVRKAREELARAYAVTDEKYHHFITEIPNRVRVGGSRENPQTEWVKNPYMTVDGRLTMFTDDMRDQKLRYSIDAEPVIFGEHQAIKASITIHYEHGPSTVSGLSSINFGGSGVDRTNPIENADTSALGRALGKLGYGLFGYGIASADEVEEAKRRQETPTTSTRPASDKQLAFLRDLCQQAGLTEKQTTERLAGVATSEEASVLIGQIQEHLRDVAAAKPNPGKAKRSAVTKLLAYAEEHSLTGRLRNLMDGTKLEELTPATAQELHETLRAEVAEHFAQADAGNDNWEQLYGSADAEAQAEMGLTQPTEAQQRTRRAH